VALDHVVLVQDRDVRGRYVAHEEVGLGIGERVSRAWLGLPGCLRGVVGCQAHDEIGARIRHEERLALDAVHRTARVRRGGAALDDVPEVGGHAGVRRFRNTAAAPSR
jgi:hypothetical protein